MSGGASLGCVYTDGICSSLSEQAQVNRLDERDISLDVSVATFLLPGLDLNTVLLGQYGYVQNSTSILKQVLDSGLRRAYLDVYYDSVGGSWNLCPQRPPNATRINSARPNVTFFDTASGQIVTCDYKLTLLDVANALSEYIELSDTNIAASMLYVYLRPKLWTDYPTNSTITVSSVSSLNRTLSGVLGNRILTPMTLASYQSSKKSVTTAGVAADLPRSEQWPTLDSCIYTDTRRVLFGYNDSLSYEIPDLANFTEVAFAGSVTVPDPANFDIDELSRMPFTDTFVTSILGWRDTIRLGLSPVWNTSLDIFGDEFKLLVEQYGFWAWAPGEPPLYSIEEREAMIEDGYSGSSQFDACAVVTSDGLVVGNCNSHFPVLCRNKSNSFDWRFTDGNQTYFDAACPKNYKFDVPSSALEMRYVKELLQGKSVKAAWVDFNSLFLPNCWVSGGTEAVCPYNVYEDNRNGVGYIVVAGSICFACVIIIAIFEWDRGKSALMRKTLFRDSKRVLEFEGVPS